MSAASAKSAPTSISKLMAYMQVRTSFSYTATDAEIVKFCGRSVSEFAAYPISAGFAVDSMWLPSQAQAHYPVVDVFVLSTYLDKLAEECKHRMAEANARNDLDGLSILNQLMFNPPANGR